MSKYKLSRIYFENYKLFKQKELIFVDCSLAVFDAIEFVITGNIKRVAE